MGDTQKIKQEIEELKKQLKDKQSVYRDHKGLLTEKDLKVMKVKELRALVLKHNLFKGITSLRKQVIIDKIVASPWFERQKPALPPKPTILTEKKNIPPTGIDEKEVIPTAPPIKEEDIKGLDELDDFVKDDEYKKLTRKQKRRKKIGLPDTSTKENPTEVNIDDEDKISIGHAIINIYTGGSSNPNIPIPQHIVRSAIDAQRLPAEEQKEIHNIVRNTPSFIPPAPPQIDTSGWKGRAKKIELTPEQKEAQRIHKENIENSEKHINALKEAVAKRLKRAGNQ